MGAESGVMGKKQAVEIEVKARQRLKLKPPLGLNCKQPKTKFARIRPKPEQNKREPKVNQRA